VPVPTYRKYKEFYSSTILEVPVHTENSQLPQKRMKVQKESREDFLDRETQDI
jgi:hypothetical protein